MLVMTRTTRTRAYVGNTRNTKSIRTTRNRGGSYIVPPNAVLGAGGGTIREININAGDD